jgi:hypothetical protein
MLDSVALYRGCDNHPFAKLSLPSRREELRGQRVELFGRSVDRFSLLDQQLWIVKPSRVYASRTIKHLSHRPSVVSSYTKL